MSSCLKVFTALNGDYHVYDGMTGQILTAKPPLIKETFSQTEEAVTACLQHPDRAHSKFERLVWEKDFDQYLKFIEGSIPGLLLQMTTRCNLNCDYCVYSGNYSHMENHGTRDMDFDTVKKSIDFFEAHNRACEEAEISFYGGETLLCFDQMKKAVRYARKKLTGRKLVFRITTNGMLLKPRVAAWLAENPDIITTVTVNGPFHDLHRVTNSGKGSLSYIMGNLRRIKEAYPQLWQERIHFIANITQVSHLQELGDFYRQEVGKAPDIITHVRSQDGNDFIQDMIRDPDHDREKERFIREYCESRDPFLNAYFGKAIKAMENRLIKKNDGTGIIGSCLPLMEKLFVHADGKFGICETACDKVILGNLEEGFDLHVLTELYEKACALYNHCCRECWAKNLCTVCYKDVFDTDGTFLKEIPQSFCDASREYALDQLRMYCTLKKT